MNTELKEIIVGIKRTVGLLNSREKKNLYLASFIMLVTGFLTNIPAVILGKLVDTIVGASPLPLNSVIPFIALIIIVILVREALNVVRKLLVETIATQTDKVQTVQVIERLLKADIGGYVYQQQIGSLHGRIFRSMQGLIRMIKLIFLDFLPIFFAALAAIGIALLQKPILASVMILVIPTGLFLIMKQVSSQKGIRVALLRGKEQVDGKVVEMLGGIETIRVMNTVPFEIQKVKTIAEHQRTIEMQHHVSMALFDAAKYLNEGFFYIVVIMLSIYFASQGIISKGDILVYSILFLSITNPLREIHRILDQAHESSLQVNDLYHLLHQPLDISFHASEKNFIMNESTNKPAIFVKNLSFSYKKSDMEILKEVNLTIHNGETIGIVGASGCGKTTFIHILLKLIHNYQGDVSFFDQKLETISRKTIAQKIAYVPQKPFIFSGTIRENILYGSTRAISDKELVTAAENAQIREEIEKSLGGFDGNVSENGTNLSGGQRQRIALARVMLQSPELIIFDEATSALDNTNEACIQNNIEKIFKGKTIISIAHRLTTLKNADRIIVFDSGRIVQEGTFDTLSNTEGLFQNFLQQGSNPIPSFRLPE
ncbi:ABC transporter ATP-binding protein [Candidatus Roizmanbacteria bacterium]|nr:ABC transporter ATP-binding protein [Candidatus Roizmanbacteria bacterium]